MPADKVSCRCGGGVARRRKALCREIAAVGMRRARVPRRASPRGWRYCSEGVRGAAVAGGNLSREPFQLNPNNYKPQKGSPAARPGQARHRSGTRVLLPTSGPAVAGGSRWRPPRGASSLTSPRRAAPVGGPASRRGSAPRISARQTLHSPRSFWFVRLAAEADCHARGHPAPPRRLRPSTPPRPWRWVRPCRQLAPSSLSYESAIKIWSLPSPRRAAALPAPRPTPTPAGRLPAAPPPPPQPPSGLLIARSARSA